MTEITAVIGAETRRRGPTTGDPQFAAMVERRKALRAELDRRRRAHLARALSDPSERLIAALGPRPDEPAEQSRWDVRARELETQHFELETTAKSDPQPSLKHRRDSFGRSASRRSGP
jgi:hypothetical protein